MLQALNYLLHLLLSYHICHYLMTILPYLKAGEAQWTRALYYFYRRPGIVIGSSDFQQICDLSYVVISYTTVEYCRSEALTIT